MNVLIVNEQQQLQNLDIDIIKSVTGHFNASEIVGMFKDFYFNKMILDVTAIDGYDVPANYKTIIKGINPDKIIFYLKEGSNICTSGFLSRLINYGIYNFTTNLEGVKYLIENTNTLKDVEHIKKLSDSIKEENKINNTMANQIVNNTDKSSSKRNGPVIVGFKNITSHAGSTSLIYMLKKELNVRLKNNVVAIEIDKHDFISFDDKTMISTSSSNFNETLNRLNSATIILVDMNNYDNDNVFKLIINLIEPSTIKINSLVRTNRSMLKELKDKTVILNQSLLTDNEIATFESESGLNISYNLPPLNDRKRNEIIVDFLQKMGLINDDLSEKAKNNTSSRIFGLFRR